MAVPGSTRTRLGSDSNRLQLKSARDRPHAGGAGRRRPYGPRLRAAAVSVRARLRVSIPDGPGPDWAASAKYRAGNPAAARACQAGQLERSLARRQAARSRPAGWPGGRGIRVGLEAVRLEALDEDVVRDARGRLQRERAES